MVENEYPLLKNMLYRLNRGKCPKSLGNANRNFHSCPPLAGHKCHDACSKTSAKLPKQTSDKISSVSLGALACFQRAPSTNPAFGPLRSRCCFLCRTASVYWRYGMSPNRLLVQRRRLAFLAREKHKKGREPGPLATSTSTKQRVARG